MCNLNNQITQTGLEQKFKVNKKPDAFHPWRKATTELCPSKSEEGIIQLSCTSSLARYKSTKFTEDTRTPWRTKAASAEMTFTLTRYIILKLMSYPGESMKQHYFKKATFSYPVSRSLLQCPVTTLPSLTVSWSFIVEIQPSLQTLHPILLPPDLLLRLLQNWFSF